MFVDYTQLARRAVAQFPRDESWCDACSTTNADGIKVCPRCCLLEALAGGDLGAVAELVAILDRR